MSTTYSIDIDSIGTVKVTKNRGQKSLRIRLSPKGEVLVSAPYFVPRNIIENYINSKQEWIKNNLPSYSLELYDGQKFGRNLQLKILKSQEKRRSKIHGNTLEISIPSPSDHLSKPDKSYIEKRMLAAMKNEAEIVLLPMLYDIADAIHHEFNQAYAKNLRSRWGSCDQHKNIILNIYLVQLADELVEYVILHELTHTKHLNHSPAFWRHLEELLPDYKVLRKQLKQHHPRIETRL